MVGLGGQRMLEKRVDHDQLGTAVPASPILAGGISGFCPNRIGSPKDNAVRIVKITTVESGEHSELEECLYHHGHKANVPGS